MDYTSKAKIENYLMIEIDASFDTQIAEWITSVEFYIDNYCGRTFDTETTGTKYYNGNGLRELTIDDCLSITSLQILDIDGDVDSSLTEGASNDYYLYPLNDTPKTSIVLTPTARIGVFTKGSRRVKIVGNWGYKSSIPADIELVATKLVASIIQKGLKGGEIKAEKLGNYSVSYMDERIKELGMDVILDKYIIYEV